MTRYGMAVDTTRCSACNACSMTCKVENNLPDGVWWNEGKTEGGEVRYTPAGEYPNNLSMTYYTLACQHCSNPACVSVCSVDATYRDPDTGIVMQDNELCIGCKLCVEACPYQVRTYYDDEPTWALDFPVGDAEAPIHEKKSVTKCTFCVHRVNRDENPACVDICPAQARIFGDLDDPDSEVSQKLATREYKQLMEDQGTGPNVFLLM